MAISVGKRLQRGFDPETLRDCSLSHQVQLYRLTADRRVLIFPDASILFCMSCVARLLSYKMDDSLPVGDMSHQPFGCNGAFMNSELRRSTSDKETFAVLNTFKRLHYLL